MAGREKGSQGKERTDVYTPPGTGKQQASRFHHRKPWLWIISEWARGPKEGREQMSKDGWEFKPLPGDWVETHIRDAGPGFSPKRELQYERASNIEIRACGSAASDFGAA